LVDMGSLGDARGTLVSAAEAHGCALELVGM
jgi:hypothetical protein